MKNLIHNMETLVAFVYAEIERMSYDADMHHDLYHSAAKRFNLYSGAAAPIWLSRVVEGVMRDYNENNMTAKQHTA